MGRRNRNGVRRERIVMLAMSVLVLTALTVTGIFVRRSNKAERENYVVDFDAIEQGADLTAENMLTGDEMDTLFADVGTDDLDYDPSFQEANSQNVENTVDKTGAARTGQDPAADGSAADNGSKTGEETGAESKTEQTTREQPTDTDKKDTADIGAADAAAADGTAAKTAQKPADGTAAPAAQKSEEDQEGMFDETVDTARNNTEPAAEEAISTTVQPTLDFQEEDGLVWPIVGDVLINYSMDKTIYFPTLKQYKYNPAIVIAAAQGAGITAAADGRVSAVGYDPVIGNNVVTDLGNGYELTYGQLENITVSEGSYVSVGDPIGTVAPPTKYYSLEGTNVYFKLTKDGVAINPMSQLQ